MREDMEQLTFREELSRGTMVFDGGMGTYFSASEKLPGQGCEMANIEKPLLISAIHREYLEAGARAIKTNTFSSNRVAYPSGNDVVLRQIRAGFRLAGRTAEAYGAHVFADIGPVTGLDEVRTKEEYRYIIDAFLEQGAKNFLFETNSNTIGLLESARYIRSRVPDAYVIISYAVLPGGYTRDGLFGEDLLQETGASPFVDAVGLNCISGVRQLQSLLEQMNTEGLTLSVMPNSGSPVVIQHRTIYQSDPKYFGRELAELAAKGVAIVGGCCGTTPKHIAALTEALKSVSADGTLRSVPRAAAPEMKESAFFRKLRQGEKPIAVEFDPSGYAAIGKYIENAKGLCDVGADVITIADCPTAKARMDSSLVACMLRRAEKKIEKGMQGLLTQPVLSRRGLENLRRAKTSLNCYILGGIMPVISERNARFMNSEVNGIDVEEALIQRYVGLNREEAENLALEVSVEIGKAIANSADGFYVITPFNRVSLVSRIVEAIRDGHVIS